LETNNVGVEPESDPKEKYMKLKDIKKTTTGMFVKKHMVEGQYSYRFINDVPVTKIAYAVNPSHDVINEAVKAGAQLLITHHQLWDPAYGGQKYYDEIIKLLDKTKLNHAHFHMPLDLQPDFGMNITLAKEMGLKNIKIGINTVAWLKESELPDGTIGETDLSLEELRVKMEKAIGGKVVAYQNREGNPKKIGVIGGGASASIFMEGAIKEGCDTYVTGDYNMYLQLNAKFLGCNLLIGSHTKTEILGTREFMKKLQEKLGNIEIFECFECDW